MAAKPALWSPATPIAGPHPRGTGRERRRRHANDVREPGGINHPTRTRLPRHHPPLHPRPVPEPRRVPLGVASGSTSPPTHPVPEPRRGLAARDARKRSCATPYRSAIAGGACPMPYPSHAREQVDPLPPTHPVPDPCAGGTISSAWFPNRESVRRLGSSAGGAHRGFTQAAVPLFPLPSCRRRLRQRRGASRRRASLQLFVVQAVEPLRVGEDP